MINDKTIQSLLDKFDNKLDQSRNIVFWYDAEKTVTDDLDELEKILEKHNIKLIIINNNYFEIKKLINKDDTTSDFLLYSSSSEPKYSSNWLLDIQLYSQTFSTSRISEIKSEFDITGYDLDTFLEKYKDFFKNKLRVAALKKLHQKHWKEKEFILGFLSVISKSDTIDMKTILRNILAETTNQDKNEYYKRMVKFGLEDEFWKLMKIYFGYESDNPTLEKLFLSFILTHIQSKTTIRFSREDEEYINRLKNESEIFLQDWMDHSLMSHSKLYQTYELHAKSVDERIRSNEIPHTPLIRKIEKLNIDDYIEADSLELFDRYIIKQIVEELHNGKKEFKKYLDWINKRRTKHWFSNYKHLYNAIEQAVNLFSFAKDNKRIEKKQFIDLYKLYHQLWYQVDSYYRKFYYHCDRIPEKEVWKKIQPDVENLYNNKLLDMFLTCWDDALKHEFDDSWNVKKLSLQQNFYRDQVEKITEKDEKVAVIISDALRYEVASELHKTLNKYTKGSIQLTSLLGVLPSYTKLGMASLLPHNKIEFSNEKLLVDGISSNGIENRHKILQNKNSSSIALQFNKLLKMNRDDAREITKGNQVIYIYHDRIDAIGDDKKTEHDVFEAVNNTIIDLLKMTKKLSLSLNVTHIFITADHGFIYKRKTLKDAYKLEMNLFDKNQIIDSKKRFVLTTEKLDLDNIHRFDLQPSLSSSNPVYVYVPYGDLRFKQKGGGINFVHGGISPQEVIIPLLYYKHIRDEATLDKKGIKHGKVHVTAINSSRKITNNSFVVKLYQTEQVTDKMKPLTCKVALWDTEVEPAKKVSDEKTVIADKTSDKPEDRQINITLTLGVNTENKTYYLRIIDDDPKAIKKEIEKIPFDVDLAISRDFGDW